MTEYHVAKVDQFTALQPVFAEVKGITIAIYHFQGNYYAYANRCPHEGGPVCEGLTVGDVQCKFGQDRRVVQRLVSMDDFDIACPWHGIEFDLKTGICKAHDRYRLLKFQVFADKDDVIVSA